MSLMQRVVVGVAIAAAVQTRPAPAATPSFADFDRRAEAGESLTVAFFGGSLTWGAMASNPQKTSYRALLGRHFAERYPKAHFTFVDAAIGGTGSRLGVFRLQRDVLAYKPDLVFLEFTVNDDAYDVPPPTLASYESLVRRIVSEGNCPVEIMFLATRGMVSEGTTDKMAGYLAHQRIAEAYQTGVGDAIRLLQAKVKNGTLDLDKAWPPVLLDMIHPTDLGYAVYAEAGWQGYLDAVKERRTCAVPETMLYGDSFMHWRRVSLSSLAPLPQGWTTTYANRISCCFDFLPSRWLDDVTVAANFRALSSQKTEPLDVEVQPLKLRFHGSHVLLFGESTPRSCQYRVVVDGVEKIYNACQLGQGGIGRFWQIVAEALDPEREHTLEIAPVLGEDGSPKELRIESICIAGPSAVDCILNKQPLEKENQ